MHCAALEQCSSSRRGWRRRGGGGEFFSRFCWIDWIRCCYLADYCCRAPDFFFLRILGVLWTVVAIPISPIRPSSARVLDCSRRPEFRIFRVEFELVLACVLDRIAVGKVGPILVAVGEVGRDMEGGRGCWLICVCAYWLVVVDGFGILVGRRKISLEEVGRSWEARSEFLVSWARGKRTEASRE